MKDTLATISYINPVGKLYVRMGLNTGWESFTPGQFVMVKTPGERVFIRRPFGIVSLKNGIVEICFKTVGKGTTALSLAKTGDAVPVLGPLGNGFTISGETKSAIIVAGGYGIAPLLPLVHLLKDKKEITFYYGGKRASDILYLDELKSLNINLNITTEDGSLGEKGLIMELLRRTPYAVRSTALYCSGPHGLLVEVAKFAKENNIPAELCLESYMACGIGVCLGCVIKTSDGSYARVCKEGPVFEAGKIYGTAYGVRRTE